MKLLILSLSLLSFNAFSAEVTVPSKKLVAAAKTLVAQTGPSYNVTGTIECSLISTGWSGTTSTCTIDVNGAKAIVEKPETIIKAVSKVVPARGPVYKFSGTFVVTSKSQEVPPYKVKESAKIILK